MPMKEQPKQVYKSAINGREIDMHKLVMQNEMTVAVGNVRVNARGDELGPNGKIIRKQEDILVAGNVPNQRRVIAKEQEPEPIVEVKAATSTKKKVESSEEDE